MLLAARWSLRLDGSTLPDRALIGGKAWSIARMLSLGLNVPPAFVITTEACNAYFANGDTPTGLADEICAGVAWLEEKTGRTFGRGANRLLLSVRSGAAISMPGMMDTVLNLGVDDDGEHALAAEVGEPRFARDTHRRFHELYGSIVMKASFGPLSAEAGPAEWRRIIADAAGADMPVSPREQLDAAVRAVFESWNTRRARRYRQHHGIPDSIGTAVTIQAMVFGNLDDQSGTGVLFSRNPLTGERAPFGEYLPRAQGEDVVSGKFTPLPLSAMGERVPEALAALLAAADTLEHASADVQDIEFTVQRGKLYLLQARSAKRSAEAAVRTAVDMVEEGLIDIDTALSRVSAEQANAILCPRLDPDVARAAAIVARGEGACPGVGSGVAVGDPDEAERRKQAGEAVVLVRDTTSPDDIHGMIAAEAVLTAQGGATSHAAVVSRALGRPCVVGAGDSVLGLIGQIVTVDGSGTVFQGRLPVLEPDERDNPALTRLADWARERCPVAVLHPGEYANDGAALDLDHEPELVEPGALERRLAGHTVALGQALSVPANAAAAYRSCVKTIVTSPVLPALLAILSASKGA